MTKLNYVTHTARYTEAGEITPPYNSIIFINQGTTVVQVDNVILAPNEFFADNGNVGELNYTVSKFSFSGAGVNSLIVKTKKYINGL